MLEVRNLVCRYGEVAAVKSVSLRVERGQLVALVGANGAGKTTMLRAISGLLRAAGGEIVFEGVDITGASARKILSLGIAHCPEGRRVFSDLTVAENLAMGAYLRADAVSRPTSNACTSNFRDLRSAAARWPAPSRVASSRCSRSDAP
jgi:branched-chain amino acid transport system ATP-binding protein